MLSIIAPEEISYYRRQQLADLLEELFDIHGKDSVLQFDLEGYGAFTFEPGRTVAELRESGEETSAPTSSSTSEKPQAKAKS